MKVLCRLKSLATSLRQCHTIYSCSACLLVYYDYLFIALTSDVSTVGSSAGLATPLHRRQLSHADQHPIHHQQSLIWRVFTSHSHHRYTLLRR